MTSNSMRSSRSDMASCNSGSSSTTNARRLILVFIRKPPDP